MAAPVQANRSSKSDSVFVGYLHSKLPTTALNAVAEAGFFT